jgi:hypothetical protein
MRSRISSRHQFSAPLDQQEQQVERYAFQLQRAAATAELVFVPIGLEFRKSEDIRGHFRLSPPARQS